MLTTKNTHKIIGAFCLLIAALPFLLTTFFLLQRLYVIHEMKEKLEIASMHTVTIDKKDIYWVKKNKEIRIGKELFDVKSYVEKDGKVSFTGLYDHEETAIENNLGLISDSNDNTQFSLAHLLAILQNVVASTNEITAKYSEPLSLSIYPDFISPLSQLAQSVLTPPPRQ